MMKKSLLVLLTTIMMLGMASGQSYYEKYTDPNKRDIRALSPLNALCVRFMPAFYLDCGAIEIEYPLSTSLSVGVNMLGKLGRTDNGTTINFKMRPETYQDAAFRAEFALKFYIPMWWDKEAGFNAPSGLYLQGNASYGNLLFYDGNIRPYTFHSRWKKINGGQLRTPTQLDLPSDIGLGGGIGYQAIVIPNHFIANIMVGMHTYRRFVQAKGNFDPDLSFYVSPSIGWVF